MRMVEAVLRRALQPLIGRWTEPGIVNEVRERAINALTFPEYHVLPDGSGDGVRFFVVHGTTSLEGLWE